MFELFVRVFAAWLIMAVLTSLWVIRVTCPEPDDKVDWLPVILASAFWFLTWPFVGLCFIVSLIEKDIE